MPRTVENSLDQAIGKRIKLVRSNANISQTALGKELKVSFQQIQKYENGTNRVSAANLLRIAAAIGVSVTELLPSYGTRHGDGGDGATAAALVDSIAAKKTRGLVVSMIRHMVTAARGGSGVMASKMPGEVREKIEAYAEAGKSGAWVAAKLGLPAATVNYRFLRAGFDPWPTGARDNSKHPGGFSPEEDAKMLELGKTMPIYKIAKALDRPITSVRIRLMTLEIRAEKALECA